MSELGNLIGEAQFELWRQWAITAAVIVVAVLAAVIVHKAVFAAAARMTRATRAVVDNSVVRHARRPALWIFTLIALSLVLAGLPLPDTLKAGVRGFLSLTLTAMVGWLAVSLTRVINDVVAARYDITAPDNLEAREMHTRVRVLQRILAAVIMTVTASLILMSIPSIRQIGVTMFASAGIAGLVAGLAARPALSNLIAGIQLALTQPIRIDDVVIVEGEWGWIEEIRTTFVVVRIWDLRRLVVPLSYFIENPFQNWTRQTADILGTVFLYADYTVSVDAVRNELHRILRASDLWDGKAWGLQVTDSSEQTMQLRALMSARDSGKAWDLRCHVRERLVDYLQREYPGALPRLRAEMHPPAGERARGRRQRAETKKEDR